jgi:hypothetical protein
VPPINALSIARPDTSNTSVATLPGLMPAVSSNVWSRLRAVFCPSASLRRQGHDSRNSRNGFDGTKPGWSNP